MNKQATCAIPFFALKTLMMKLARLAFRCVPLVLFVCNFAAAQQAVPFNDKRWAIKSQGHIIEAFQGYQSIYLQNGEATLTGEKFLDGVIEFDVWLTQRNSFSGFIFRQLSPGNHEEIYFRPHQSGNPDAFQYTPVFNNIAAWQLYHDQFDANNNGLNSWRPRGKVMGYNGVIQYRFHEWMHVKLIVSGTQAELYLNHSNEPTAFIRQLAREPGAGAVGVKSSAGAAWFANFTVTHVNKPELKTKETVVPATPPGTILNWQVSGAFRENAIVNLQQLDSKFLDKFSWKPAKAEPSGILNLARFSAVTDSTNTMLVRLTINSVKDQVKKLELGYSDRVRVYCNGQVLYSGTTGFRTRDYRYLGTIGYFDAVYLPLKKGDNTIVLAVSEGFGGWGLLAKMDAEGPFPLP